MSAEIKPIGAIVTYVIPAGECPTKTLVLEARGDGTHESVAAFYERCKSRVVGCDLIRIELKEIE